jgi:hypothetical protein
VWRSNDCRRDPHGVRAVLILGIVAGAYAAIGDAGPVEIRDLPTLQIDHGKGSFGRGATAGTTCDNFDAQPHYRL